MKKDKGKKSVEAFSLAPLMRGQITALIEAGYYTSRSDVIKDAMRALFEKNKMYAISTAAHLYRNKMITLEEAMLMAGKDEKDFLKIINKK